VQGFFDFVFTLLLRGYQFFSFPDSRIFFGYSNEPPSRINTAIENRKAAKAKLPKINSIKDILKFALINLIASNILFLRID
jgi:hypothetical protein